MISTKSEPVICLGRAKTLIDQLLCGCESEIAAVGEDFEELASHANEMLRLASSIVELIGEGNVGSVLPKLLGLETAAAQFIRGRLEATSGVLEVVASEAQLLDRLRRLNHGYRSIARETQMLSVITNIEVARLGKLGAGFTYLAHELDDFSLSVGSSTKVLANHTEERRAEIEDTRRTLALALPRIQGEFERIECEFVQALKEVEAGVEELASSPVRFSGCVEEIARQISGVITAVQANDVTRQQMEHVREALLEFSASMGGDENERAKVVPRIAAGLTIQVHQVRNIRETMSAWSSQMGTCLDSILRVSSSEVAGIGRMVLKQEQGLSSQLIRIDALESECEADSEEVRKTLTGLSKLMQLVGEHLSRSRSVRDQMRLLNFNSMIEASHLGSRAGGILEVSCNIKRISEAWSEMADKSEKAMGEILALVGLAEEGMKSFSDASSKRLRETQSETRAGLDNLRAAAAGAAENAAEITKAIGKLHAKIATARATTHRLNRLVGAVEEVLREIEGVRQQFQVDHPGAEDRCDRHEAEELFSAPYTTEVERLILRAALYGEAMPTVVAALAGNDVELF